MAAQGPNTEVCSGMDLFDVTSCIVKAQLWLAGHLVFVVFSEDPTFCSLFYKQYQGVSWEHYKDSMKSNMKCSIDLSKFKTIAEDHISWRIMCSGGHNI